MEGSGGGDTKLALHNFINFMLNMLMIISYLPRSLALLLEGLKLKALGEDGEEEDAHDGEEESDWLLVDAALREVVGDFEVFLTW